MISKARHGPCSQEALKLRWRGGVGVGKIRNQAIRNQCEREVSTGCYGNKKRGHSCCSSPSEGWLAAGKKEGTEAKQADLLLGLTPH